MGKLRAVLVIFGCLTLLVACPHRGGGGNCVGDNAAFKQNLLDAGFLVDDTGQFVCANPVSLFCAGLLPNALGQNSDSPYLTFKVGGKGADSTGLTFQMRPDEAVVFLGKTPPEAVYFSFTAFLDKRYYPELQTVKILNANIGDSINHRTIKTAAGPHGSPFDADTVVIVAADRATESKVRQALEDAGFPPCMINTLVIDSDTVRLGAGEQSDTLYILTRCAFFEDPAAGDAYLGRTGTPSDMTVSPAGVVWRVTPDVPAPDAPQDPLCAPPLRVRGTGHTEFDLWPDVEALRTAIINKYPDYDAQEFDTEQAISEGAEAIQRGYNMLAPSRDTIYLDTPDLFGLAEGEFVVVYGVNHAAANKALYCNAVLYSADPADASAFPFDPNMENGDIWRAMAGLVSINSETDMQDSAREFLSADAVPVNEAGQDLLYARKFARTCDTADPANCTALPPAPCERIPQQLFQVGFRAYVEPKTKVGPAYNELVYDRVIKFTPKAAGR